MITALDQLDILCGLLCSEYTHRCTRHLSGYIPLLTRPRFRTCLTMAIRLCLRLEYNVTIVTDTELQPTHIQSLNFRDAMLGTRFAADQLVVNRSRSHPTLSISDQVLRRHSGSDRLELFLQCERIAMATAYSCLHTTKEPTVPCLIHLSSNHSTN